jgi:hypothetical protein
MAELLWYLWDSIVAPPLIAALLLYLLYIVTSCFDH